MSTARLLFDLVPDRVKGATARDVKQVAGRYTPFSLRAAVWGWKFYLLGARQAFSSSR
ncbi:MAG: hypothetical protein QUS11_06520 [Candidatus Fermentibacter sp.]|nr:hypothetical protein [Candidatus Fermentibacter sp.]